MLEKTQEHKEEEVREEIPGVYEPSAGYIHVMARVQYHLDLQEEKQRRQERIDERRYQDIPKDDRWTFYDTWCEGCQIPLLVEGGSHLYGMATPESDLDLYGIHVVPPDECLNLQNPKERIHHEQVGYYQRTYEYTTYELKHFCKLILNKNGNILEILFAPQSLAHQWMKYIPDLQAIVRKSITRYHGNHFKGFAETEWKQLTSGNRTFREKEGVKKLLYLYQKLMIGIHLLRTGEMEPHLPTLMKDYPEYPVVRRTLEMKVSGQYDGLTEQELLLHKPYYLGLLTRLEEAYLACSFPNAIPERVKEELNEWQKWLRKELYRDE